MLQLITRTLSAYFGIISRVCVAVRVILVALMPIGKMNCVSHHAVHLPQSIQQDQMLNTLWKMPFKFMTMVIFLTVILTLNDAQAVTPPGTIISNTATSSFDVSGTGSTASSNPADVTSTIIQTPSSVTFYQYDITTSSPFTPTVVSQHATSGPPGAGFVLSADPVIPVVGGAPITLTATNPQPLNIATSYQTSEAIFVQVDDKDQNLNPAVIETVNVVFTSSTGDTEEITLSETAVNTGVFVGYVQSSSNPVASYDGLLSLGEGTSVAMQYIDQFDLTDVSTGSALVDPFGVIFSSLDGSLIDGATVTILDLLGNPAAVFGDDGVSIYPNPVTSGGSATDSGGTVYNFPAGGYRFPRLLPADYSISIVPPTSYTGPSTALIVDLQLLPGAPFALDINASFGGLFTLLPGPPLNVDIPLDPIILASRLVIEKTVSKDTAAIGDFVQYTLTLTNNDVATASNIIDITDTLPTGLRYQANSARYDGAAGADPQVSGDGRTLVFNIASLAAGVSVEVKYVTEITSATKLGKVTNSVIAVDNVPTQSNVAVANLTVTEDLFASRSFIAGRVIVGECVENASITNPGVPTVRVFMEDGTYAATDEQGRFHFEGVKPGTHVVQLDKESIPAHLEVVDCVKNTRFAGTPYSQFVDIQGGSLWRTDFYLREKKPLTDKTSLLIQSQLNEEDIKYTIKLSNGEVPVENYRLIISLPKGIEYISGSSVLDSQVTDEPTVTDNMLIYRFGNLGENWSKELKLRGSIKQKADGDLVTIAFMMLDVGDKKNIRSAPLENRIDVERVRSEKIKVIYRAYFNPLSAELSYTNKKGIRDAFAKLGEVDIINSEIKAHSDSRTVSNRSWWLFRDNSVLSVARAKTVGDFMINDLNIDKDMLSYKGEGATKPVANNATAEGRSLNRRAEVSVTSSEIVAPGQVTLVTAESDLGELTLEGQPQIKIEKLIEAPPVTEQVDISSFDEFWIKDAVPGYEWLSPDVSYSPSAASINIAIKHKPSDKFEMMINGKRLNPLYFFGLIKNKANTVARSYWQGVALSSGENRFDFIVKNSKGKVIKVLTRHIVYAGIPVRAELVEQYSRLIADGRHVPVVAIRVYDSEGNFARPGSTGKFILSEPYLSQQLIEKFQTNRLSGLNQADPEYVVGQNGIAFIVLEPTTETGKLEVKLPFSGRKASRLQTWMQPEVRDWIMVGLAEGTVGYNSVSGNKEDLKANDIDDEFYTEGKVAFYAKGKVKGDWLLTTSYDTSKEKGDGDNRVNQLIDPNTYYTIYGDNSRQRHDASSAEKLYIKIERQQFYALFGDMDTGLNVTELSKFNRRMTGVKSEYDDGKFTYTAFAAENLNNFIKDEIQGQGISGLYRLSGTGLVINSDDIIIETRDRFRSEIIIKTETMRRYLDYSIDYINGTIFFRKPIPSRDENFNPVFIVVDYEVESAVKGDVTAGGRGAVKFNEGKVEIGGTLIHDSTYLSEGDLIGADARVEIDSETEIKIEAATTDVASGTGDVTGSAFSAAVVHGGDKLKARAYAKQEDADFGLGQQSISQTGTRKYGADADYQFNQELSVDGTAYHEDNLVTDGNRDVAEANVRYNKRDYTLTAGARIANDTDASGVSSDSTLLLLGASKKFLGDILNLRGTAEIAVNSANANVDYPSRYILGADYFITPTTNLFAENEWTVGRDQDTQMTRAGVRATPWTNAHIDTSVNQEVNENGLRSFATLGLTQSFVISNLWSGDVAFDQSKTMRTPGGTPFNVNVPIAQGTSNNDFTAVSFGTTYTAENYTLNNRVEVRTAEQEDQYGVIFNWERNLKDGIGYSATTKLFKTNRNDSSELLDGDIRFSMAYRPQHSRWITLNRLDFEFDSNTDLLGIRTRQRKLIENLASNFLIDDRNQLALNFGLKYVIDDFAGDEYSGITTLLGSEYRHDISEIFDFGVHGHIHHSANSNIYQYSTGVSFGWNMSRNIWLSVGYNFDGFEDNDFRTAGYTANGPYINFRVKFDQDTAADVQDLLN